MVLASSLWAEEKRPRGVRNAHMDATTSTEGIYTGVNTSVVEK